MKTSVISLILMISMIVFNGFKKDKEEALGILGRWTATRTIINTYTDNILVHSVEDTGSGLQLEFFNGGKGKFTNSQDKVM